MAYLNANRPADAMREFTRLVGAESGRAIRLGDPVTVQVERVDAARGRVDLSPVALG